MKKKFTPGPWNIVRHGWSDTGIYSEHDRIAVLQIDDEIDENEQEKAEEQQEANSRLIAAAPDLYDALERISEDGHAMMSMTIGSSKMLLAALERARGGNMLNQQRKQTTNPESFEGPTGLAQAEFWVNTRALYRRIEELERTVKVILTWADFDINKKHPRQALVPKDVSALCNKVMKDGEAR